MSTFRNRAAALAALVATWLLVGPAAAQLGSPLNIIPEMPEPAEPEAEEAAEETFEGAPSAESPPGAPAPATGVEIGVLEAVDLDTIGLLAGDEGGFGMDMWRGTSRAVVETLLPRLPAGTTSAAVNGLMRRLLLSTATPPEGPANADLLSLRTERLTAMGDSFAVGQLMRAASVRPTDGTLARALVDGLLLGADNARACPQIRKWVRQFDDPYWQKALIFCQALANEHAATALGIELLRESGTPVDPAFATLVLAVGGDREARLTSLPNPTALHVAMLRAARLPVPADTVETAGPGVLRAVASAAKAPAELRLRAAERAEMMGALTPEAVAELYGSVPFTPEELANPLARTQEDQGPLARALLYQASQVQVVPTARAEALQKALGVAREAGGFGAFATAARVHLPALVEMRPSPELVWFAGDAARALLATGEFEAALGWLRLAEAQGNVNAEAAAAATALWPLVKVADTAGTLPWDEAQVTAWWEAQRDLAEPERRARGALLLALFSALGEEVSGPTLTALLEGPLLDWTEAPNPGLWSALTGAVEKGRVGETVLLSLLALDRRGPGHTSPLALGAVVGSLGKVGLGAEARALAVEAILARGL
ncbi:MAG: hypothetical protein ACE5LL_05855 [Alphaproteobacteria bacterium]